MCARITRNDGTVEGDQGFANYVGENGERFCGRLNEAADIAGKEIDACELKEAEWFAVFYKLMVILQKRKTGIVRSQKMIPNGQIPPSFNSLLTNYSRSGRYVCGLWYQNDRRRSPRLDSSSDVLRRVQPSIRQNVSAPHREYKI